MNIAPIFVFTTGMILITFLGTLRKDQSNVGQAAAFGAAAGPASAGVDLGYTFGRRS